MVDDALSVTELGGGVQHMQFPATDTDWISFLA